MERNRSCVMGMLVLSAVAMDACGRKSGEPEPVVTVESSLTVTVGPGQQFATIQAAADSNLQPGDVVEVYPGVYTELVRFRKVGAAGNPITIRGITSGGQRPVIRPPSTMTTSMNVVHFNQSHHYVFENFEIDGTGSTYDSSTATGVIRCIFHEANDITLRNVFVHDCPAQGILGADEGSGSITIEFSEVARCGTTDRHHNVYIATDPFAFPGSVFRLQHSYIHDSNVGNLVKSRAERNEIYYNWIENPGARELELIGMDDDPPPPRPMNSDVVGNVIVRTHIGAVDTNPIRLGHDWDGSTTAGTHGNYRFVNNTIVMPTSSTARIIRLMGVMRSVELHNNVFYKSGQAVDVLLDADVVWSDGTRMVAGQRNWVPTGSNVPPEWTETRQGTDPGFLGPRDFRLASTSALKDQGTTSPPVGFPNSTPFPSPLYPPQFVPPLGAATTSATSRAMSGTIDIGAYEAGSGSTCSYALGASGTTMAAAGGTGNVTVTAGSGCAWTATSGAAWVTITSGASGNGNGTVGFSVQQNSGAQRTATLTIAGLSYTITQSPAACSYTVSPASVQVGASGTTSSFNVLAGTGCTWSAASGASWLTITSGASGSGNGAVAYSIATNSGNARAGTITVAGQTHTVNQAAAPPMGSLIDLYTNQTDVAFAGGSTGVQAAVVAGEGVGGSNAIKHTNLQIWDATRRLQLSAPVDISTVQTGDKLRISLDVSAGRASNIYVYFNNDWQTSLVTPVLDQTAGYQTFDIDIPSSVRTLMGNSVNDIYFKAGSGFPDNGTLWVDNIQFVRASSSPPPGALGDIYTDQTNVSFVGGTAGVQAAVVAGEGVGGSNAIKHSALQIWDATKKLQLATAVDISGVQATDKLRISLDVSPGRASNIYVYFNDDWQTYLVTPVLDQTAGYQTFDLDLGAMRTRMGNSVNDIYFKAGSGFPDNGTLWVDNMQFVRP
jgi:hypothetical protein